MSGVGLVGVVVAEAVETGINVYGNETKKHMQQHEAELQQQQIQLQETRAKQSAAIDQSNRAAQEQKVLSTQKAVAAARGLSESSGSFGSLVAGSEDAYAKDNKTAQLSLSMTEDNLQSQIYQNQERLKAEEKQDNWNIFGDVAGGAVNAAETGFGEQRSKGGWREVDRDAGTGASKGDSSISDSMSNSWI